MNKDKNYINELEMMLADMAGLLIVGVEVSEGREDKLNPSWAGFAKKAIGLYEARVLKTPNRTYPRD